MQDLYQDEYENLSLKLVAIQMYSDELRGEDCKTCDAKTKKLRNCEMRDLDVEVWYNDTLDININTCPLNCIFLGHYSFLDKYDYYTRTSANMPSYDECDSVFWRLYQKFDNYKNIIEASKVRR